MALLTKDTIHNKHYPLEVPALSSWHYLLTSMCLHIQLFNHSASALEHNLVYDKWACIHEFNITRPKIQPH